MERQRAGHVDGGAADGGDAVRQRRAAQLRAGPVRLRRALGRRLLGRQQMPGAARLAAAGRQRRPRSARLLRRLRPLQGDGFDPTPISGPGFAIRLETLIDWLARLVAKTNRIS